jgi:hypothetical protein
LVLTPDLQHVKKDTDWLWEWFLLQDFPLFHERCYLREGEPRTSGWRRMYKVSEPLSEPDFTCERPLLILVLLESERGRGGATAASCG